MAYYTVAHILQGDNFRGNGSKNKYNIDPKDMTPEVWDHIFFKDSKAPKKSNIPKAAFDEVNSYLKKKKFTKSIFCDFKNGQKSIFELGKSLRVPTKKN